MEPYYQCIQGVVLCIILLFNPLAGAGTVLCVLGRKNVTQCCKYILYQKLLNGLVFADGAEDSLLQDNISAWDMFASPNPYEEGSFESSILDHMRQATSLVQ